MESCPQLKRIIQPTVDWNIFLKERKEEFQKKFNESYVKTESKKDFEFIAKLGEGTFGEVFLAEKRKTGDKYAIKISHKIKSKKVKPTFYLREKRILQAINFPFCIHLVSWFENVTKYYLCLPYISGGDMYYHLKKEIKFAEETSKFYGGQVVLALEYIHHLTMVYRDLKPENIVLDSNGYLKLIDFGFCKRIGDKRTYTFCGTPEYLAPEIIIQRGYGKSVDWWSFGVLLFEMVAGYTPFYATDTMVIYEKSTSGLYEMPKSFSAELSDLIKNLLQLNLSMRYGNLKCGINDIKFHAWFDSIDWLALLCGTMPSPYKPITTLQTEEILNTE